MALPAQRDITTLAIAAANHFDLLGMGEITVLSGNSATALDGGLLAAPLAVAGRRHAFDHLAGSAGVRARQPGTAIPCR